MSASSSSRSPHETRSITCSDIDATLPRREPEPARAAPATHLVRMQPMAAQAPLPGDVDWFGSSELHRYLIADVFTSRPLEGNQLAVFLDGQPLASDEMQRMAREMNLAETVFLLPPRAGGTVGMRIFTPAEELPFAGHPVLGAAVVVGQALAADSVALETGAGIVPVTLEREGERIRSEERRV